METLKIAFYTDSFLPARDGVVTSIINTRRELMKRGHEVYIFTSGDSRTRRLVNGSKNIFVIRGMKLPRYPQYKVAVLPFMTTASISEIDPDIIHTHTPFFMGTWGLAMAKINKIPIVSTFHTLFNDKRALEMYAPMHTAKFAEKYSWRYVRFYYNKCNVAIAPSETIKQMLAKHGVRNISVVPNGLDINRFNPHVDSHRLRKKLQMRKDERIVLYLGRISKEKRLETLLRAARLLKEQNVRFVFAGTGPALDHYRSMAHRLRISDITDFVGFVEDRILPSYYKAADAFCIPSTFETQGIAAYEALACGTPVIAADSLALREAVQRGRNGELFKPNDFHSCARKIDKVINTRGLYKETRKTAENYSVERTTDRLLEIYKRVIKEATV
jgi:1,2-diacylglycerol 3-alpha-glucosyltransferase